MDTNALLSTGPLAPWVLILGLFLPRLALFFAAFDPGAYPPNPLPDLANFVLWLIVPRFLMAFYIYVNMGPANIWFWAYVALGIAATFGEGGYVRHRVIRRTTVSRDGQTTTTVEEEEV